MTPTLHGLWPALMTPLAADLTLDAERGIAHAKSLLAAGTDGITLFGTTGEGASFSVAERMAFTDALIAAGVPAARMIVCTTAASNVDQITLTRHAAAHKVAAVLILPPFFFRNPTKQGIIASVAEVIDAVNDPLLSVILYHIPQLSGIHFTATIIHALVERYPTQIIGVKDSAGNLEHALELIKDFPTLQVFVGAEEHIATAMQVGGAGSVCGLANLAPRLIKRVIDHPAHVSPHDTALIGQLLSLIGQHSFVSIFKIVLAEQKNDSAWLRVRPPMSQLDADAAAQVVASYRSFEIDPATI
ncbi:dihydrodipicolinate synthase family protein [Glaciimonas sp. GG7]